MMKKIILFISFISIYPYSSLQATATRTNLQKRIAQLRLQQEILLEKAGIKNPTELCPTKPPKGAAHGSHHKQRLQRCADTLIHQNLLLKEYLKAKTSKQVKTLDHQGSLPHCGLSESVFSPVATPIK